MVAPCVGAWVEIRRHTMGFPPVAVAPCVGAWVEINIVNSISHIQEDNIFTDFRHFLQRKEFVKKTEKLAFVLFLFILGKKSVLYSFV